MPRYVWAGAHPLRRHGTPRTIQPGEQFEPTDAERSAFGDLIDVVDDVSAGTCDAILKTGDRAGEVCGEELPCPWH